MKISQKGLDLIKEFEGFRGSPYRCPAGKLTIGYGHVIDPNVQKSIVSVSVRGRWPSKNENKE